MDRSLCAGSEVAEAVAQVFRPFRVAVFRGEVFARQFLQVRGLGMDEQLIDRRGREIFE